MSLNVYNFTFLHRFLCQVSCVACPPPCKPVERRSRGSGTAWRCLNLLCRPPRSSYVSYIIYLYCTFSRWNLWTVILFFCSVTSLTCLSVLGEGSLLCDSFWGSLCFFCLLKGCFFLSILQVFPLLNQEHVVHCTDCNAPWGYVIVILGYMNKIDLIWRFNEGNVCLWHIVTRFLVRGTGDIYST